jgi:hypothetical protein
MTKPIKVPIAKVYEDLTTVGDKISTQVRTIAVGLLALVWLVLTGGDHAPSLLGTPSRPLLVFVALLCILTLVFDYLQYLCGWLSSDAVRKKADAESLDETSFNYDDVRYRLRNGFFWLKQILAMVSVVLVLIALVPTMW